jgi:hypothetical protein
MSANLKYPANKEPKSNHSVNKKKEDPRRIWGPYFWDIIHFICSLYTPDKACKRVMIMFLSSVAYCLPCLKCRDHYISRLQSLRQYLGSNYDLFTWSCIIHAESKGRNSQDLMKWEVEGYFDKYKDSDLRDWSESLWNMLYFTCAGEEDGNLEAKKALPFVIYSIAKISGKTSRSISGMKQRNFAFIIDEFFDQYSKQLKEMKSRRNEKLSSFKLVWELERYCSQIRPSRRLRSYTETHTYYTNIVEGSCETCKFT